MTNIEKKEIQLHGVPAILWGAPSARLFLYIHGQGGNKNEAAAFSEVVCRYGWQVLSLDLPEHGDRKNETNSFDPWHIIPELTAVMQDIKCHWDRISLFANSIGAWFSMLSFGNEPLERCFLVSPVLDMKRLISKMMDWAGVSEARLQQERIIPTSFGQTLSWTYWEYVLEHPITEWTIPTTILYGENDNLIERDIIEQFAHTFGCDVTIMPSGEHWFHTEQQLAFMYQWVEKGLCKLPLPPFET